MQLPRNKLYPGRGVHSIRMTCVGYRKQAHYTQSTIDINSSCFTAFISLYYKARPQICPQGGGEGGGEGASETTLFEERQWSLYKHKQIMYEYREIETPVFPPTPTPFSYLGLCLLRTEKKD
jgi:hypothetical protein